MAELGKLTAIFDADTRKFDAGVKNVDAGIKSTTNSLDALSSKWKVAAGVSVAAAAAIGGVTTGLFNAARSAAAFGGGLVDLSQRTGITVGTLSTLKLAADQSGGSIEGVNKALGKYLGNISDASNGNEKLRAKFESVGFSAADLNKAYGDSDAAVSLLIGKVKSLGTEQDQLNLLQKAGVKNAQELNGIINSMTGTFEEFRAEAERLGLVITPEQAEAADKFDDSLKILELQVKGMANTIAFQYLPQISGAINDVSGALAANKGSWAAWGDFIRTEIRGVRVAASGLAAFIANIPGLGVGGAALIGIATGVSKSRELHREEDLSNMIGAGISIRGNLGGRRRAGGFGGGGGGGRGGGGGSRGGGVGAAATTGQDFDEYYNLFNFFKKIREENEKILSDILHTPVESIEALQKLYETIAGGFGAAQVGQGLSTATGQLEALIGLGAPSAEPLERQVASREAVRQQMFQLGDQLSNIFAYSIQSGIEEGGKKGLASFALGLLNIVENVFLRRLAEGLGNILSTTATGGGGGILGSIIRSVGGVLGGAAIGGLTGVSGLLSAGRSVGPLSTTTNPLLSGLIHRASGGPVSAGMPYLVGERGPEMFIPGQSGNINSNAGMTININVPVKSAGSYSSPKSRRELAQTVAQALQGAIS